MKTVLETAAANELAIVEQLVARLKTSVESNCPPVDSRGDRLFGVTLKGNDRTDLVKAIAAEAGMSILPLDGEALALGRMPLPKFNVYGDTLSTYAAEPEFREVPAAFARARQLAQESRTGVVLYVRDFGKVGARRQQSSRRSHGDTLATQFMVELHNLERDNVTGVFVIVSMTGERDLALARSGRLPRLEALCSAA